MVTESIYTNQIWTVEVPNFSCKRHLQPTVCNKAIIHKILILLIFGNEDVFIRYALEALKRKLSISDLHRSTLQPYGG